MVGFHLKLPILGDLLNLLRGQLISESILFLHNIFLLVSDQVAFSRFHWGKLGFGESELEMFRVLESRKLVSELVSEIDH
jgi:hypothetical protein